MRPDPEKEFEKNMVQLIQLLKKVMAGPIRQGQVPDLPLAKGGQNVNINFCFFSFFPISAEDMDELEDLYDQFVSEDERKNQDLTSEITPSDLEFLRKNGIRF